MQVILLLAARELLTLLYEFLKFAVDQRYKAESTIRYIHIIKSFKNSFFFRNPQLFKKYKYTLKIVLATHQELIMELVTRQTFYVFLLAWIILNIQSRTKNLS